ncbi:MAG TPA: hypothetical protein DDW27_19635 [Bacteroidales bacterium]|nr:hypothetical protein [Bacteroidales bacterium]
MKENMKILKYLFILILPVISISCRKIEQLPPEPRIEFRHFAVFDTIDILGNLCKGGRLNFYFEDGDGNLGLQTPDGFQSDTANLFLTLFRKVKGIMTEVPDNDILKPSDYRIPYMERTGQNKILKGTISITFLYLFYSPEDTDTVRYDFYIKDRSDNISNTESTSEIFLSVNDIYKKSD